VGGRANQVHLAAQRVPIDGELLGYPGTSTGHRRSSITAGARSELQSKVARTHEVRVDDLARRDLRQRLRAVGEQGLEPRPQLAARSLGDFRKESLLYFRAVLKHVCLVKTSKVGSDKAK
jgi:hypothetical protein